MKNFDRALKLIEEDFRETATTFYAAGEIESVQEMIEMYDYSSAELKEEIYQTLKQAASSGVFPWCFTDDCEIEEENGDLIPYRVLVKEVRKITF